MGKVDFKAVKAAALVNLPALLQEWMPGGVQKGKEYFTRNPTRDDRHANSFSVNAHTGAWHDFASGDKGGDPISLYAFIFTGGDNLEAAKQLGERFAVNPPQPLPAPKKSLKVWVNATVPENPPPPQAAHPYRGLPGAVYTYRSANGQPIGYVYRFTSSDGSKVTLPLTWCKEMGRDLYAWAWVSFAAPRPLYGLDRLAADPDALVIVVEGEKCADAGAAELPEWAWVSWPGGGKAATKADWTGLKGRRVVLWPDCDGLTDKAGALLPESKQPGIMAMKAIAEILVGQGCDVLWLSIPKPLEKPSGWDVADAIDEGLRGHELADYIVLNSGAYVQEPSSDIADDVVENLPREILPPCAGAVAGEKAPVVPAMKVIDGGGSGTGRKRKDLEEVIDKTEDFDDLTGAIKELVWAADISDAGREYLLKKISKKTGSPRSVLGKSGGGKGGANGDGWHDGGFERHLEDLNRQHAVISVGGRVMVLNREYDLVLKKNYFTFSSRKDFEFKYCNQPAYWRGEQKSVGEVWVNHPARAQYAGIAFLPGDHDTGDYLNLWQGWGVEPSWRVEGCYKFLEFISTTICSGDDELFDYIIKWCAHLVQRPQELPETAIVLRGKEGAGKNRFLSVLEKIVGAEHFLMMTSVGQLTGRFTGHLANVLLAFCNEAVWGGDKSSQGTLKSMITDPVQPVEHKGAAITQVANFKRLLMASNEDWVVPRGANDRHYVIVDVDGGRIGDHEYWKDLTAEIDGGAPAAFMRYLLDQDLSGWHPRQVPVRIKEQGWDLKLRGGGSVVQWWFDVLDAGVISEKAGEYSGISTLCWPERLLKEEAHDKYVAWAVKHKMAHIEIKDVVFKQLQKWGAHSRRMLDADTSTRRQYILLPAIDVAREKFSKAFDMPPNVFLDAD